MAYASVGEAKHRTSNDSVNDESGFSENPRKRWWQRAAQAPAPTVEHDGSPKWDAPTQAIPTVPSSRPAPQVLYRERPADLDKAAYNIALAANTAGLHRWSAIRLEEQLATHLRVLHAMAEQERAEGRKLLARREGTAGTADAAANGIRKVVRAVEQANGLAGVTVEAEIDAEAYGRDLGAAWANAHALNDETMQFQPITPDMPDPRVKVTAVSATAAGSPVHVPGEDLRPPVPDEDEDADPGASSPLARQALPRRPRVTVMTVPVTAGEHPEPAGLREVRPAQGELGERDWVFDDSEPGVSVLKLVSRVAIVYDGQSEPVGARVFFAAGGDRRVPAQAAVRAMRAADAEPLVKAREAEMDEMEASR